MTKYNCGHDYNHVIYKIVMLFSGCYKHDWPLSISGSIFWFL